MMLRLETNAGEIAPGDPLPECLGTWVMDIDAAERMLGADLYARVRFLRQALATRRSSPRKLAAVVSEGVQVLGQAGTPAATELVLALRTVEAALTWAIARKARWVRLVFSQPGDDLQQRPPARLPKGSGYFSND